MIFFFNPIALSDHCELPPPIPHGVVTGEKDGDYFRPYDEAVVVCEPGYKHATEFVMCEEEGEWEDEFGECTGNPYFIAF